MHDGHIHVRKIKVKPSCFAPSFIMEIDVPDSRDDEEYIDEFLEGILDKDIVYNIEWVYFD